MNFSTYQLKIRSLPGPGGKVVLLCDHAGNPFLGQQNTVLESSHDDLQKFTVTFIVDGRHTVSE